MLSMRVLTILIKLWALSPVAVSSKPGVKEAAGLEVRIPFPILVYHILRSIQDAFMQQMIPSLVARLSS